MIFRVAVLLAMISACYATCPAGSIQGLTANKCYEVVTQPASWYDAVLKCRKQNGELATVETAFINVFLVRQQAGKTSATEVWLGGSRGVNSSGWTWLNGAPIKYTAWDKGEPLSDDGPLCLSARPRSGLWYSEECTGAKAYVCEVEAIVEPVPTCPTCPACPTTPRWTTRKATTPEPTTTTTTTTHKPTTTVRATTQPQPATTTKKCRFWFFC
ncbi:macrophage mannose receptor 1-like protein [Aphelenchoides avenae]|nr:macrophage mannose receptor 1-like protein [Aphelenchus avenae]